MQVSELSLGAMTFGAETGEAEAHAILDRYAEAGGRFLDVADVYSAGEAERIVGRWLARSEVAEEMILATKARFSFGPEGEPGLSRRTLTRAVDASLERLGVESIDLHYAHGWDPLTPLEETLDAYGDLVAAGKLHSFAVSNFSGWQLQRAALLAREDRRARPVALQPQYNLLAREIEWELVPVCEQEDLAIVPWSPLAGGWLTGKYGSERPSGATRLGEQPERGVEAWSKRATERTWRVLDVLAEVAREGGHSMSQVALAWLAGRPQVASVILGVRTVAQLEDNLACLEVELSAEQRARLDDVSEPERPDYPYGLLAELSEDRVA